MQISMAIMKRAAALGLLLSLVLVSPTFAVLRPRYPIKPTPPSEGHWIVIGGNILQAPPRNASVPPQK